MRNHINATFYIEDLRPTPPEIMWRYKDRFLVKLNGYAEPQFWDIMMKALVEGDYTVKVAGRLPGHHLVCLGWESRWGQSRIAWEEPVTEMIGSFRLNEILCRYAHDAPHFKTEAFDLDGVPHVMQSDGYLLRGGEPILRVMNNDPIPICLRLAGTAHENYSFTHEIPVRALSGDNMHRINYLDFERMIRNTLAIPGMNIRAQFNLVLGIRRWAHQYALLYSIPHLAMTDPESLLLAKAVLLDGGQSDVYHITSKYRELYDDYHLPGLDQDILNEVNTSQA